MEAPFPGIKGASVFSELFRAEEPKKIAIHLGLLKAVRSVAIEKEKLDFTELLGEIGLNRISSSVVFWQTYQVRLPNLSKLALILLNIPASSAFVERFFSICGVVCRTRAGNMSPKMIISRSLLKANLWLLEKDDLD